MYHSYQTDHSLNGVSTLNLPSKYLVTCIVQVSVKHSSIRTDASSKPRVALDLGWGQRRKNQLRNRGRERENYKGII